MFYDSHCHIYEEYYNDIDNLIKTLKEKDFWLLINNGYNQKSNEEVLKYTGKYNIMFGALGIHPEHVNTYRDDDILFIENNIHDNKIVAVGEIGLDYHYSKENKIEQRELFEKQLSLAERYHKPVIIHSREATQDTINVLNNYKLKGSIHSFSGSYETALQYIKMGFVLGINGVITFKNSNLKDVIKKIGIENIIIETDSPYLAPHPLRGSKNTPENVKIIINFLANLFCLPVSEVVKITNDNLKRVFDIQY